MKDLNNNEIQLGPVTPEEAELLTSITRMINAHHILEFGYYTGTSARAFLKGMKEGMLVSIDILDRSEFKVDDSRHVLIKTDMTKFDPSGLPFPLDIVFFDASHSLEDNVRALKIIEDRLTIDSLIIVHDTGYWDTSMYTDVPWGLKGIVPHRPEEKQFVWFLKDLGYDAINLGTIKEFRCGLTVLQ